MTDADRIDFLQGQVQALSACLFALIENHQDLPGLSARLALNLEGALAKISGETVPEAFVDGLQEVKERVLRYVASAVVRRDNLERS